MSRLLTAAAFAVAIAATMPFLDSASRGKAREAEPPNPEPEGGRGMAALAADRSGHFTVTADVRGRTVDMMVDTGATTVTLTNDDARRLGLVPRLADYTVPVATANGIARAASVRIDELRIGSIRVRDVKALVAPAGALAQSLLGMSFINRLSRFELRAGRLILEQ